jgi:isocitrate dehydrogenase (NAD+)
MIMSAGSPSTASSTSSRRGSPRVAHRVTLIPGDGVGPEVTEAARRALDATGVALEWDRQDAGYETWEREGTPLPERVIESIRERRVALKGPTKTPVDGFRPVNMPLRAEFDLYAGIRPCRAYAGVPTRYPETDIVIVRMTHEDLYAGVEYGRGDAATGELRELIGRTNGTVLPDDSGVTIKWLSSAASRRLVSRAFAYAAEHDRRRVTAVHKANVMKESDGVFLEAAREVAAEHPEIEFDDRRVDSLCCELVLRPGEFDVLAMPLFYGDFVSDLGAGLVGGLGMAPGVNLGDDCAIFEAVHGTAPKHAGRNRANPLALMLSGVMMLRHLNELGAAGHLERAITEVVREGRSVTYDLKPSRDDPSAVGTAEVADAVIEKLGNLRIS